MPNSSSSSSSGSDSDSDDKVGQLVTGTRRLRISYDTVHINLRGKDHTRVERKINKIMIEQDGYNPNRAKNFPSKSMTKEQREKDEKKFDYTLRRKLAGGISDKYYENWNVPERSKEDIFDGFREIIDKVRGKFAIIATYNGETQKFYDNKRYCLDDENRPQELKELEKN